MTTLVQRINGLFRATFTARPREGILKWAAAGNIKLSTKESGDFPGNYDPQLNPLPTILFEVYECGKYHKAVFKKSSQSGVTLACLILICWFARFVSRNFLYVIDSIEEMRRISKERLKPMIQSCRALSGHISEGGDNLTNLTLSFKGLTGYLCGSNSIGVLANKSVGLAINDETDTYKDKRAIGLSADRGKKQSNFFQVLLSKPEDWSDTINQEYLAGTRHQCFFPCPHCGTMQTVTWERIKYGHCKDMLGAWDYARMASEMFLECVNADCGNVPFAAFAQTNGGFDGVVVGGAKGGQITEDWKPWMMQRRQWRATNEGKDEHKPIPGVFSCHIDDLMSTFPTATWPTLAREHIAAQGDEEKLKIFHRGRLAHAWRPKAIEVGDSDIYDMTLPYLRGHCPVEPLICLMASDVQQDVKKWVKTAWNNRGDCYVIDWGECLSFGELVKIADDPVIVDRWNKDTPLDRRVNPKVFKGLVDEGNWQKDVRDFVVSTFLGINAQGLPDYRFMSVWGQPLRGRNIRDIVWPAVGERPNAMHNGYPIWAYRISDNNFKHELYNNRIARHREIKAALAEGKPPPAVPRLFFPAQLEPAFVRELCAEKFVWSVKEKDWIWEDPKTKNDFGDALKYNFSGWYVLAPLLLAAPSTVPQTPPQMPENTG